MNVEISNKGHWGRRKYEE